MTPPPKETSTRQSAADAWRTIRTLLPYLWPKGSAELKARVVTALLFLLAAKLCNVYVPMLYKRAVDSLSQGAGGHVTAAATADWRVEVSFGGGFMAEKVMRPRGGRHS